MNRLLPWGWIKLFTCALSFHFATQNVCIFTPSYITTITFANIIDFVSFMSILESFLSTLSYCRVDRSSTNTMVVGKVPKVFWACRRIISHSADRLLHAKTTERNQLLYIYYRNYRRAFSKCSIHQLICASYSICAALPQISFMWDQSMSSSWHMEL